MPSTPASLAIRLALLKKSSATSSPIDFLNAFIILSGDISSVAPTAPPSKEAIPLSPSVASPARARSLASPAPADTANPAARGNPKTGTNAVAPIPRKEPKASPNLRPNISSEPLSAAKNSLTGSVALNIPSRAAVSVSSPKGVTAPNAADSPRPTAPPNIPLINSSPWSRIPGSSTSSFIGLSKRSCSSASPSSRSLSASPDIEPARSSL